MRIAFLGATSHIAKNLILFFASEQKHSLYLFARNAAPVWNFLSENSVATGQSVESYESFNAGEYDAIINCVGIADPGKQKQAGLELFLLTERFDNMVLAYLEKHPRAKYINFSSGAVYGSAFPEPVTVDSMASIPVNKTTPVDYYRIAKLNSETKHRAAAQLNIVDLRIFSFFSRHIDLNARFLMSELVRALKDKTVFRTSPSDIVRDFVAPADLCALVESCLTQEMLNEVIDVYSRAPVRKTEIIASFANEFGLLVEYLDEPVEYSATGPKDVYFSLNTKASIILAYKPNYTSLEGLLVESRIMLE